MRRGAFLSMFVTLALGVRIGYGGFFERASAAGAESARLALQVGAPDKAGGVGGVDQTTAVTAALQGTALVPFAFFLFTPLGWLADYLVLSAVFRAITLAVDKPWGDPLLTAIDTFIQNRRGLSQAQRAAEERALAEGPEVPDEILECRKFAGKEADFVVVSSRVKEGWTRNTTVVAAADGIQDGVRLRVGDPLEKTLEGRLRMCYPLKVIRDIQVDRRIVHYSWPEGAPVLAAAEAEAEEE